MSFKIQKLKEVREYLEAHNSECYTLHDLAIVKGDDYYRVKVEQSTCANEGDRQVFILPLYTKNSENQAYHPVSAFDHSGETEYYVDLGNLPMNKVKRYCEISTFDF